METKVNIINLEVDIISIDYLILNCKGFLTYDGLNIIYLVQAKTLQEAIEDSKFKEILESADFVLPADETLLSLHHVDTLQTQGMIVDYRFLYSMFDSISEEEKTVFIIGQDEKEIENYKKFSEREYPNLKILGSYHGDLFEKEEIIINEINSIAPDILLVAIDTPIQEKWITANKTKLNSKLCIAIGTVINNILNEQKEPPTIIRKLHLVSLYHFMIQNKGIRKLRETRIFRKKVAQYKNKKGDGQNGDFKQ